MNEIAEVNTTAVADDLFCGYGVEVDNLDGFHKVIKTLERMGIASGTNELVQSCHLLHKRGRYAIMHFKELFALDGKVSHMQPNDITRRNTIAYLLDDWGLVNVIDKSQIEDRFLNIKAGNLRVISINDFHEKWTAVRNYTLGNEIHVPAGSIRRAERKMKERSKNT